jgi:hypothetical protein
VKGQVAEDLFRSPRESAIDALHEATGIYTAQAVADEMLSRLQWPDGDKTLLDSSCGDGIFLKSSLEKLFAAEPHIGRDRVLKLIGGWEIHPVAAQEARARIAATLCEHGWALSSANATAGKMVVNADFLTEHPGGSRHDVIVGNPPYLRYVSIPSILRAEYEATIPGYATNDLLHSFIDRSVSILNPGGEIAVVTSDRWLFNQGSATLRQEIGQHVGISCIERLDANTAFYRPKLRKAGTPARVHPVIVVLKQGDKGIVPLNRAPIYPDAIGGVDGDGRILADIARVRICPWLGKEGVFVVSAAVASKLPPEYLVPAVDTDDIKGGLVQIGRRYAIRTFPNEEPPREIADHLQGMINKLSSTAKRHQDWWLPPEPWHNYSLDKESLLIPRIATELKFVQLPPGVLGINHNLTVICGDSLSIADAGKMLKSPEAQEWACKRAARLENGFFSFTTTLLRRLPVFDKGAEIY